MNTVAKMFAGTNIDRLTAIRCDNCSEIIRLLTPITCTCTPALSDQIDQLLELIAEHKAKCVF